jgi:hypothetical protein
VVSAALRVVGNIVTGDDYQTQVKLWQHNDVICLQSWVLNIDNDINCIRIQIKVPSVDSPLNSKIVNIARPTAKRKIRFIFTYSVFSNFHL